MWKTQYMNELEDKTRGDSKKVYAWWG